MTDFIDASLENFREIHVKKINFFGPDFFEALTLGCIGNSFQIYSNVYANISAIFSKKIIPVSHKNEVHKPLQSV